MTTKLYSYWRSSASWRVRITLNLKGIPYEYEPIHLAKDGGEQHTDHYREINAARLVPSLEIDGHTLSESLAIVRYLDATRPDPALVPSDPYLGAKAWQLAELINAGIQPIQNLRVMQALGEHFGANGDQKKAWARHWITRGFEALETFLAEIDGVFCVGDEVTIADICLVPQVYNARRFGVDLGRFPHILAADAELSHLDAFERAQPKNQPDAV
jgi:maleylacetoacetate isomerase